MAIIDLKNGPYSLGVRGKIGKPNGCGDFVFGFSDIGDDNEFSGIYQRRPRKKGSLWVKMRHALIPNPQTETQQKGRTKFAQAVEAWNNLSFQNQIFWNKLKQPEHISGYNRFISWYMKSKENELGVFLLGDSLIGGIDVVFIENELGVFLLGDSLIGGVV